VIDVNKTLEDLERLNEGFEWAVKEASLIHRKIKSAFDNDNMDEVNLLRDKFLELENRHEFNKKLYNSILKKCKGYFLSKYGLDISNLF